MTLALHERGVPWHIILMIRQLCIELAMRSAIELHPLELAILASLIGIKEPSESGILETFSAKHFLEILT